MLRSHRPALVRRAGACGAALVLVLSGAPALAEDAAPEGAAAGAAAPEAPRAEPEAGVVTMQSVVDGIAAQVGTEVVLISDVRRVSDPLEARMRAQGATDVDVAMLRADVLDKLIDRKLVALWAKRAEIEATDPEIDEAVAAVAAENQLTPEQLRKSVEAQGLSWDGYRARIGEEIIQQKAVGGMVRSKVKVEESELEEEYRKRFADQPTSGEEVHIQHIAVAAQDEKPESLKAACQRARAATARIRAGEDFLTVAEAVSHSRPDLGWLAVSALAPWMVEQVESLQAGQVSNAIELPVGCAVLKLVGRREVQPVSYEQAREQLQAVLFEERFGVEYDRFLARLRKQVYVERKGAFANGDSVGVSAGAAPGLPVSSDPAGPREIVVRGARVHNLRGIDVRIPRDRLVVITGLSGSGKSSLAFDTLYAEGQRRYVESLSAYARQFLDQMSKPDVESIEGLSPAISIEQRTVSRNPRSTVGTVTEILDHLRLLFARAGDPHCWQCGQPIQSQTVQQMTDRVLALAEGTRALVLAPIVRGRKGEYKKELDAFRRQGFVRVRVDGAMRELADEIKLARHEQHDLDLLVDRIAVRPAARGRLAESIETASRLADGLVRIDVGPGREEWLLSQANACPRCGVSFPEIAPRLFSFNSPAGACPRCDGLGTRDELDPARVVPDADRPLAAAIEPWGAGRRQPRYYGQLLASLAAHFGVSLETPWRELPDAARHGILFGVEQEVALAFERGGRIERVKRRWDGVLGELERRGKASGEPLDRFRSPRPCPACDGSRLRLEARSVKLGGLGLDAVCRLSIAELRAFLDGLALSDAKRAIAERVLREIRERLRFLVDVGLDYLALERAAASLSGGEAQRIRLATQVGASLMGVLYVLDEPSIGLHPRDNRRLLDSLLRLRDQGNSVVVVEHDEETIRAADWVVDMGPGAGIHGGAVVAEGPPAALLAAPGSLTGDYLAGRRRIEPPAARRAPDDRWLVLRGCAEHNLKQVELRLPIGLLTVVTGVSGSGKSTLVNDTLHRALAQRLHGAQQPVGRFEALFGLEHVDKVIDVDQSPIGRTPRSNPATYTGAFDAIRRIFAQLPEARVRGFGPGRFSFNVKGGRCEACQGDGELRVEMHFLPDLFVTCEVCRGRRYDRETLEVRYKGQSIADVLGLSVEEALPLFESFTAVRRPLETLRAVGLDYVHLGQSATTLSGGEAQRIKLGRELARRDTGRTLYLLDEPTTGLHFADVERLLGVLRRLVELGNTVVVIEHHLDVVRCADWVIDLGPEGGEAGGRIVVEGAPEVVARCAASHTGAALAAAPAR